MRYNAWLAWMRDNGASEQQLAFWKQHLEGAPERLDLPTDLPRTASRSASAGLALVPRPWVRPGVWHNSRAQPCFPRLAAYCAVLEPPDPAARRGCRRARGGTHWQGRRRPCGLFDQYSGPAPQPAQANAIPRTLLGRTADLVRQTLEHQLLPFDQLVENLSFSRSLEHSPVFQAMFAWQSQEEFSLNLRGVRKYAS